MNHFPKEEEKFYRLEIPLSEYERMKDKITQFEIFKRDKCYFKEFYDGYNYKKYSAISENTLLKEVAHENYLQQKETSKYMLERNEYHQELKRIKKSIFYKLYKIFN